MEFKPTAPEASGGEAAAVGTQRPPPPIGAPQPLVPTPAVSPPLAQPPPAAAAASPPQHVPGELEVSRIGTQQTVRRARATGGVFSLPVTAFTQEYAAHLAPGAEAGPRVEEGAVTAAAVGGDVGGVSSAGGEQAAVAVAPSPTAVGAPAEAAAASPAPTKVAAAATEVETGTMPPPSAARGGHGARPSLLALLFPAWWRRRHPPDAAAAASREYAVDEHKLTVAQLGERFATHVDTANPVKSRGLTRDEAARRLASYGPNRLTPPPELPEILKFLKQFTDLLIVMLIVAAGLAFLGYGLNTSDSSTVILAGTLSVIILITCSINYWHERQTSNVLASIRGMLPSACIVVRDGVEQSVPAESLVLGDVVHLKLGNRVPADIRLIQASDLKIEMSSLTGEPDAVDMGPDKRSDIPTEARNLVFNSSLVMNGEGRGVVYRVSDDTYIGAIAGLAGATEQRKTSMQIEVEHTAIYITAFAVFTAVTLFVVALARGLGFTYAIVYGFVLVLVANVPEGLPTTVISILALAAERMSEHHILIKQTAIVEALGSTTIICTDKTGTLTMGVMTVENVWTNKSFHPAGKVKFGGAGGPRRADPAANMTVGRQMSMTRDGTMVIHSTATRGRGALASVFTPAATQQQQAAATAAPTPGAGGGLTAGASHGRLVGAPSLGLPPLAEEGAGGGSGAGGTGGGEAEEGGPGYSPAPLAPRAALQVEAVTAAPAAGAGAAAAAPYGGGGLPQPVTLAPLHEATAVGTTTVAPSAVQEEAVAVSVPPTTTTTTAAAARRGGLLGSPQPQPTPGAFGGHSRTALSTGGGGGGGGGIDRSVSLARQSSYASFYSFQGMTGASWARSNAFTRLITIAAICNRAQFSYEEGPAGGGGEEGGGSPGHEAAAAAPAVPAKVPLRGPYRKKRSTGTATGTGGGAPAAAGKTGAAPPAVEKYRGDKRRVLGDASEAALLRYVDSLVPIFEFRMGYTTIFDLPFNSVTKTALAIARDPEDHGRHILMLKGAPEKVLERCSRYIYNGVERPIDADFQSDFTAAYERFALLGERVLGFAYASFPGRSPETYKRDDSAYPQRDLVFCGLISLLDPPKPGVDDAIDICRDAYIRVTMVTGDHPLTAEAIARKVGIVTLPTAREVAAEDGVPEEEIPLSDPRVQAVVIAGYALPALTPAQWDILLAKEEVVFARTTPQQKLQIVEHYQRLGNVVAVTGDGTNDSPALKRANIGVAMGSASASDVAREAADILILDDNFASIVHAIEMGRLVFDNLRKTIAYTLAHAMPELVPIFLTLAFGIPLALPGLLILTIDLLTEQTPAISLAYEPAEADLMRRPPRDMKVDRLVDGRLLRYSYLIVGLLETGWCLLSFFTVFAAAGVPGSALWDSFRTAWNGDAAPLKAGGRTFSGAEQQTIYYEAVSAYYLTLVACQAWHVFTCKTRYVSLWVHGAMRNSLTAIGVMVAIFLAILFIYISALQGLFNTSYLGGYWWLPHIGFGVMIFWYTEHSKKLTRANPDGWWARHMQW